MKLIRFAVSVVVSCYLIASVRADVRPPILQLPTTPEEMIAYCQKDASLSNFARNGEVLTAGWQVLLLGTDVPIADKPQVRWARPYYRGKVRILAFLPLGDYASIASIYRSLDCELSIIQMPPGGWFEKERNDLYRGFSAEVARKALEKQYDVIFLCSGLNSGPQHLPADITQRVLDQVRHGTGLVMNVSQIVGGGWPLAFWPEKSPYAEASLVTPTGGRVRLNPAAYAVPDREVVNGVPFILLPPMFVLPMKVAPGAAMALNGGKTPPTWQYSDKPLPLPEILKEGTDTPLVITGKYGDGKVVTTTWATNNGFPAADGNDLRHGIDRFEEYHASLISKLILWAAGKQSGLRLDVENTTPGQTDVRVILSGDSSFKPAPLRLEATVRDLHFREVWQGSKSVSVATAPQSVIFNPPQLPDGKYAFDVIARNTAGASVNWGSAVLVVTAPEELEISTDKESYKKDETVVLSGKAQGLGGGPYSALLRITDSYGRLVREERAILDAQGTFTVHHPLKDSLTSIHTVEATLLRGDKPCARTETSFYCPSFEWKDFHNICWGDAEDVQATRDWAGIDAYVGAGWPGHEYLAKAASKNGLKVLWTNVAPQSPEQTQKEPEKSEVAYDEQVQRASGWINRYGAIGVCFQDERHSFNDPEPNAECLRRFHEWLKEQYGSLEKLNASWESSYLSWDEVKPLLTDQFKPDRKNLAPWLDFRLFISKLTIDVDARQADALRKATSPDQYIGIEGVFGLGGHIVPYSGFDYSEHARRCFNMIMPYDNETNSVTNLARSFCPGPLSAWDGYSAPKWQYYGKPWWGALHGYWGMSWFCSKTFVTSTGCVFPQASWVEDTTRKLRHGVGKLLMTSKLENDPIAILYSQPSIYAAHIAGKWIDPQNQHLMNRPSTQWGRENLQRLVNEFGVQYSYVAEKDVVSGALAGKKLLILPDVMCLSKAAAEAIERFVTDGGVVLADLCPALWDEHGHPQSPGYLDKLFGVSHDAFQYATRPVDYLVGTIESDPEFQVNNEWFIGEYYEKSLKVADGKALGVHIFGEKDVPAFVLNRTGKGAAVLMNFLETNYQRYPEGRQRVFMCALLDLAKIERPIKVMDVNGGQLYQYDVTRFADGDNLYVGVYRLTTSSALNPEEVTVRLPRSGHLYEVKTEKYLGNGAEAKVRIPAAGSALIAILPYRIDGLTASVSATKRGEPVTVKAALKASGTVGRHIFHVEVYDPDGNLNRAYSTNVVAPDGKWEGCFPTALNDRTGKWKVKVKEVVTGVATEVRFKL